MARKRDALSCRARNWTDDESKTLFNIYGDYLERKQFEGLEKHNHVYMSISRDLENEGFSGRQWRECKNKILNLKAMFQKEKKKLKAGSYTSEWPLFNDINKIMGNPNIIVRRDHFNDILPHDSLEVEPGVHLEDDTEMMLVSENHHCDDSISINSFASGNSEPGGDTFVPDEKPHSLCSNPTIQEAVRPKAKRTRCRTFEGTSCSLTTTLLYEKIVELMEKRHKLDVAAQARENALAKSMKTFFEVQTKLMQAQLRQLNAPPSSYIVTPQSSSDLHTQQLSGPSVLDKCQQVNFMRNTITPCVDRPISQPLNTVKLSESDIQSIAQQINLIRPTTLLPSVSLANTQPNHLTPVSGLKKKIDFSKIKILKVRDPFSDENPNP